MGLKYFGRAQYKFSQMNTDREMEIRLVGFLMLLLILAACNGRTQPTPPTEQLPTPITEALTPTTEAPTAVSTSTNTPQNQTSILPAPTLFDNAWDDRDIFRANLVSAEQPVLDTLTDTAVYHIDIEISSPSQINGTQEVRYTNQSNDALDRLYFHQFPNQLGGTMTISNVRLNGQAVDALDEGDVMQIPLAEPLQPGEQVVVAMDFVTEVPTGETSTKYNVLAFAENILTLAHFYPMIATYQEESGWHIEPSPPNGDETFAESSLYLVKVSAPSDLVMAASGTAVDEQENGDQQTITYAAGPARDFFLAASTDYVVNSKQVGDVRINSYTPANLKNGSTAAIATAAAALQTFEESFSPYPYSEFDIVSTPTTALGIEYPGIIANNINIFNIDTESSSGTPNSILLESTTAHEVAHQWFYNMVGNDQLNEPWLDEALTQYATMLYYADQYGQEGFDAYYASLDGRWARVDYAEIPVGMPAGDYNGAEYGAIVYGRGPIFVDELAKQMGTETFTTFMQDYNQSYRWQIATTQDFKELAEFHCDCDLSDLFNTWVFAN